MHFVKVLFFAVSGLLVGSFLAFVIDALFFMVPSGGVDGVGAITMTVIFGGAIFGIPGAVLGLIIGLVIGVQKAESWGMKFENRVRVGIVGALWGLCAGIAIYSWTINAPRGAILGAIIGAVIGIVIANLKTKPVNPNFPDELD